MRKFYACPLPTPPFRSSLVQTPIHTYFRIKFVLLEIIFDPSLILSPHIFLLGLIFADRAFAAPNPKSAAQLSELDIRPSYQQLELLFKPSMLDVPVFRKSVKTKYSYEISPYEPLTYATLFVVDEDYRRHTWALAAHTPVLSPFTTPVMNLTRAVSTMCSHTYVHSRELMTHTQLT